MIIYNKKYSWVSFMSLAPNQIITDTSSTRDEGLISDPVSSNFYERKI